MSENKIYYAHTGLSKYNIPPQRYEDHIKNVFNNVENSLSKINLSPFLKRSTLISAGTHDLGKLLSESQEILSQQDRVIDIKMKNHVDAGVAWCVMKFGETKDLSFLYAAYLVHSHHRGLQNRDYLFEKQNNKFSQDIFIKNFRDINIKKYIDKCLDDLYKIHFSLCEREMDKALKVTYQNESITPFEIRMALSVLVDADHRDTADYYSNFKLKTYDLKPEKRIRLLNKKINDIKNEARFNGIKEEVIQSRGQLYDICSKCDIKNHNMFLIEAPVGKGKTLAGKKLALRISKYKNKERIYSIAPLTNIISQTVREYKKSILDKREMINMGDIFVNEIHSKLDFDDAYMRKYSQLWNAPINVSTSYQFFNSIFSNHPSCIRKLHNFANSVIILDEYHAAFNNNEHWHLTLKTLKEMSEKFNIDFIFMSGTNVYFWEIFNMDDFPVKRVVSDDLFEEFIEYEKERIRFNVIGQNEIRTDEDLYNHFNKKYVNKNKLKNNVLMVFNTIANAIQTTKYFRKKYPKWNIYHLSSALMPKDRDRILDEIHEKANTKQRILCVATSIVENGIDFKNFEAGYKEKASLNALFQFGGRIGRNTKKKSLVYEFSFDKKFLSDSNNKFTDNPNLAKAIAARKNLQIDLKNCTNSIYNSIDNYNLLINEESFFQFMYVDREYEVIPNLTETVIIDNEVIKKIKNNEFVRPSVISRCSVNIFRTKLENNQEWSDRIEPLDNKGKIYAWTGGYDENYFGIYSDFV